MKKIIVCLIIALFLTGCNTESILAGFHQTKGIGTLKNVTSIYIIQTDSGSMFAPTNLSKEFMIDNLRVEFEGTIEKDNSLPINVETLRLTSIRKI